MCPKSHTCFTVLYSTLLQYTYCVAHYFSNTFFYLELQKTPYKNSTEDILSHTTTLMHY